MSLTISFGSITLASRDRLRLGPPDFPRLKRIHIQELRAYAPEDVPESAGADMARLRAMNANVEQLEIGVLTIFRGGLDIKDVLLVEVKTSYFGGLAGMQVKQVDTFNIQRLHNTGASTEDEEEDDDGAVTVRSSGSIRVKHIGQVEMGTMFNGIDVPMMKDVTLVLPAAVDPNLKWAPVQVAKKPFRSTG
jgi:hypothetical protein